MKLTDQKCKKAITSNKSQKLFDGGGLYLEVTSKGNKAWKIKYRFVGKEKKLSIGPYPLISLKDAREHREEIKKLLLRNIDPAIAKKTNKELMCISSEITFEKVAREWHDVFKGKWSKDYTEVILKRIEADLLPSIGNLPIRDIKAVILLNALRRIENRGVYETTKRARQYCSQILRYAVANGWVERDVSVDIIGAFKQVRVKHYSALDSNDLPEFLKKLERNEARLFPQTRIAIELMLHTFVRTNELLEAKWQEFDIEGKTWLIPAERMKMRKAHLVPLSTQVLSLLYLLKSHNSNSEFILTSLHSNKTPMSNNTILYALYRMGYKGKTTGHGFRALAMTTIKEKLGYRHEVIDRQLAHAHRNSVDAAYDRSQFIEDRRKMMQEWGDYIHSLKNTY